MKKFILFLIIGYAATASAQTNPDFKDWVTSLIIDSKGIMYAGTSSNGNGIFISTNRGETWTPTKMRYGVTSMTLTMKGTIVAFAFGYSYGRYLFRLSQGGTVLDSISMNFTPASIIASRNGTLYALTFGAGIFKSTDDGGSWSLFAQNIYPIANPSAIAATKEGIVFVASNRGVFRSTDAGISWEKSNWGRHDSLSVSKLLISNDGTMYGGGYEGFDVNAYEIFRSTDVGINWTLHAKLKTALDVLAVDSTGTTYAGNVHGVYRITAAGDTSYRGLGGIARNGYGVRSLLALRADTLFVGGWGGVFRTTNAGTDWALLHNGMLSYDDSSQYTSSLPFGYFISCGIVGINGTFIVGTDSAGIFRSMDQGKTWMQSSLTLPLVTSIISDTTGYLFAATAMNGVYGSLDQGASWDRLSDQLGMANGRKFITLGVKLRKIPYVTDPAKFIIERTLFGGTDAGLYTYILNMILPSWHPPSTIHGTVTAIRTLLKSATVASSSDGKVYQCTSDNVNWNYRGVIGQNAAAIVSNREDELFAVGSRGVFRSTDLGLTWVQKNSGITDTSLISAAVSKNGMLFAGSFKKGEIYRSSDRGENWKMAAALSYPVRCLLPDDNGDAIYAASADRLFRSTMTSVPSIINRPLLPEVFVLDQNYPNPFNPSTTLRYRIPEQSRVKLTVFNSLGQRVSAVFDGIREAGEYEHRFNASHLSSGAYFYRIEATSLQNSGGTFTATKIMLMMK